MLNTLFKEFLIGLYSKLNILLRLILFCISILWL